MQEKYNTKDLLILKDVFNNGDMGSKEVRQYCKLDTACSDLLKMAMTKLGLSARAYDRILKVSRTIADLKRLKIYYRSILAKQYNTEVWTGSCGNIR